MQTPLIDPTELSRLVRFVDILAAVVFAVSGALVASRKRLDVMGFMCHEIYVTASVLGACTYVGLNGLGVGRVEGMSAAFLVTFGVRGLAIRYGWSLPVFRESTKRERWKTVPKDSAGE